MSVVDVLRERGFIKQFTHEKEIEDLLAKEKVSFYIGFDPTADSLHVGHFVPIMAMAHMQQAGHRPILLIGGGTTMVGDPSGKTDMRKMLDAETIRKNGESFVKQSSRFLDFGAGKALLVNNADWLLQLNYVHMLREIGTHFSVNRMLTAECFKQRLEKGLSFLEFNYMLMQAYDFLELYRRHECVLELGGDDQWSNIIAGADLIRRKEGKSAYGMTLALLTTSEGRKMGKTEKGALWLDPEKTSPYDFYQYWRNVDDADVEKCLALLTFLPMAEVKRLGALRDKEINDAKKILAYEITKNVHGAIEADKAQQAAEALFGSGKLSDLEMPTVQISDDSLGKKLTDVLCQFNIVASKSEARRLIEQGGLYTNETRVTDIDMPLKAELFSIGELLVRKGKKKYFKIILK